MYIYLPESKLTAVFCLSVNGRFEGLKLKVFNGSRVELFVSACKEYGAVCLSGQ